MENTIFIKGDVKLMWYYRTAAVENLLAGYSTLIKMQREVLTQAGDADDEGTASLMGDYISEQEKLVWMLKAYLD